MSLNFETILLQPLRRIWRYKALLWFNLPGGLINALFIFIPVWFLMYLMQPDPQPLSGPMIAALFLLGIIGSGASLVVGTLMRIVTILAAEQIENNQELPALGELLQQARTRLLPVVGLNLLLGLGGGVVMLPLALSIPLTAGVAALCAGPLMLMLTPVLWLVGGWTTMSQIELVLTQVGILESLRRGWARVRAQWVSVLLLMFVIAQITGFLIMLPASLPFIGLAGVLYIAVAGQGSVSWLLPMICLSVSVPLIALGYALYTSLFDLAWLEAYRQLKPAQPE